jgi:hypothetical protein
MAKLWTGQYSDSWVDGRMNVTRLYASPYNSTPKVHIILHSIQTASYTISLITISHLKVSFAFFSGVGNSGLFPDHTEPNSIHLLVVFLINNILCPHKRFYVIGPYSWRTELNDVIQILSRRINYAITQSDVYMLSCDFSKPIDMQISHIFVHFGVHCFVANFLKTK